MDEETLSKLLGVRCNVTCGCGNPMIKATGIRSYKEWFLTCEPYSDQYKHPQQLSIPKNCQLLKDHHKIEQIKDLLNTHAGDLTEDVQKILDEECQLCWNPELIGYDYDKCPDCGREV